MRSFEERKAEVFRRSENKIKERKRKRNRILVMCIPLCFILTVCLVLGFSPKAWVEVVDKTEGNAVSNINISNESNVTTDKSNTSVNPTYVSVEVKSNENISKFYTKITDATEVKNVYENISRAFVSDDESDDMVILDNEETKNDSLKDSNNVDKNKQSYTITITLSNGKEMVYILSGKKLCDVSSNIETELTHEKLEELKSAIGLIN